MLIRKKAYKAMQRRVSALETELNDKLCTFATLLAELQDKLAEQTQETGDEFKQERAFLEGLRGIMSYEAPYGKKQNN